MSTEFVTLKKSDPLFLNYLWGSAETLKKNNLRALPVKTYNLGTIEESVTFEVQSKDKIQSPNIFSTLISLMKLNTFILVLFPAFYLLVKNHVDSVLNNPLTFVFAVISSLFLFAAINIRNDIVDHISGFDRVNIAFSKKAIRSGWISARSASIFSWALVLIAAIWAVPVVIIYSQLFLIIAVAAALFAIGRFYKKNSYKDQHFGEIILFVVSGPLLSLGLQMSMGAPVDDEVVSFGTLWGFFVVYLIQVNNFSHMMTSSLSGIKNTMTKLGFDVSQKVLIWWWLFLVALCFLFLAKYSTVFWSLAGFSALVLFSIPLCFRISNIKSPMGSGLIQIKKSVRICFVVTVLILFCERISKLTSAEWF